MKISIGCDHAGFEYKEAIKAILQSKNYEIDDKGTHSDTSIDYPDYAHPVAEAVHSHAVTLGILICGSGNGVCMTANKYANVRAALCWDTPIASLARQHNDANVICIPARFVSLDLAIDMVRTFLDTPFEGGRHATRVQKIGCR